MSRDVVLHAATLKDGMADAATVITKDAINKCIRDLATIFPDTTRPVTYEQYKKKIRHWLARNHPDKALGKPARMLAPAIIYKAATDCKKVFSDLKKLAKFAVLMDVQILQQKNIVNVIIVEKLEQNQ